MRQRKEFSEGSGGLFSKRLNCEANVKRCLVSQVMKQNYFFYDVRNGYGIHIRGVLGRKSTDV